MTGVSDKLLALECGGNRTYHIGNEMPADECERNLGKAAGDDGLNAAGTLLVLAKMAVLAD